jgi:hypothetical protein
VRREAVKTLGRIGNSTIVPYIIQATKDSDPGVRLRAIKALGKLGEREEIIPVLERCAGMSMERSGCGRGRNLRGWRVVVKSDNLIERTKPL